MLTLVEVSHEEGVIENEERLMITNVVDFGDSLAKDVMVPRMEMSAVPDDISYNDLVAMFEKDKYSRLPVYSESIDNVTGVVHLKDICFYLNDNLKEEIIATLHQELDSISEVMRQSVAEMFTSKNSFLWFVSYHKFCETGIPSERFMDFMEEFKTNLHSKEWHGKTFDDMNKVSTKKKSCIIEKLQLLEDFMQEFLFLADEEKEKVGLLDFIKENVKKEAVQEDLALYQDMLEDLIMEVNNDTKLLDIENRASLIALVGYACEQDIDVDEWFVEYFKTHTVYRKDQKSNFRCMAKDLQKFIKKGERNGRKSMVEYI